jgi:hypothetical protein
MAQRDEPRRTHRTGPGDRLIRNFLADLRLRFLVHTIALGVGAFLMIMFDLPALFGIAFVGWWVVWTMQRDSAEIYHGLNELNEQISGRKREFREFLQHPADAES